VAAVFPEQFQSFTDTLKTCIFIEFFGANPSQLFAEG
jgi:hypothetical protein